MWVNWHLFVDFLAFLQGIYDLQQGFTMQKNHLQKDLLYKIC